MITVRQVQDACCGYFDITRDQLLNQNRRQHFSKPRQIAMFLARELTGASWGVLGQAFCRDHTTALHGYRTAGKLEMNHTWGMAIAEIRYDLTHPHEVARRQFELLMRERWRESVPPRLRPGARLIFGEAA